jgi:hypothetical protein
MHHLTFKNNQFHLFPDSTSRCSAGTKSTPFVATAIFCVAPIYIIVNQ